MTGVQFSILGWTLAIMGVQGAPVVGASPVVADPVQGGVAKDSLVASPEIHEIQTDSSDWETVPGDTVDYEAEHLRFDDSTRVFQLRNQAKLQWKTATLTADTVEYASQARVIQASGQPRIREKDVPPLAGERMKFNLESKVGQVFYGTSIRDGQLFNGMDVRRLPDGRLQIARGDFSTCDSAQDQHFYFYSRRMVVKPGQTIVAKPVVLNIADVPVMLLPIMANPLNKERRSGLLLPKYGGDQKQGFYLENLGYYWAINDYLDADFKVDLIEGSEGTFDQTVAKSDVRYALRYWLTGSLNAQLYLDDFTQTANGWNLQFNHQQTITPDNKTTLNGSGSFVSRPTLRQSRGLNRDVILDQQANAQMTFRKQFKDNSTLNIEARQDRNLRLNLESTQDPSYRLTRTLPAISYSRSGSPFLDPEKASDPNYEERWFEKIGYNFSLRSSAYTRESTDSLGKNAKDTSWYGYRQDLSSSYPGKLGRFITTSMGMALRSYWAPEKFRVPGDSSTRAWDIDLAQGQFGTWYHKPSFSASAETKLFGIFRPEWGSFTGVRHTVVPRVSWLSAPKVDSTPGLVYSPDIHERSGQVEQQSLQFGLGQDLDVKWLKGWKTTGDSGTKPEYSNIKLIGLNSSIAYNFAADSLQWSDINSNLGVQITESERLNFGLRHSLYDRYASTRAERLSAGAPILQSWNFGLSRSLVWKGTLSTGEIDSTARMMPWSGGMSYSFSWSSERAGPTVFRNVTNHSASTQLSLRPTYHWQMDYRGTYDFRNGRFAEHSFAFKRDLHCWDLNFSWIPTGPSEGWTFQVRVTDIPDIELHTASQRTGNFR